MSLGVLEGWVRAGVEGQEDHCHTLRINVPFTPCCNKVLAFFFARSNMLFPELKGDSVEDHFYGMDQGGKPPCMWTAWCTRAAQRTYCSVAFDGASVFFHSFPNPNFSQICINAVSPHVHQGGNVQRNLGYDQMAGQGRSKWTTMTPKFGRAVSNRWLWETEISGPW